MSVYAGMPRAACAPSRTIRANCSADVTTTDGPKIGRHARGDGAGPVAAAAESERLCAGLRELWVDREVGLRAALRTPAAAAAGKRRLAVESERHQVTLVHAVGPAVRRRERAAEARQCAAPPDQNRHVLLAVHRVGDRRRRDAEPEIVPPQLLFPCRRRTPGAIRPHDPETRGCRPWSACPD